MAKAKTIKTPTHIVELKKLPVTNLDGEQSDGWFQISKDMKIDKQLQRSILDNPDVFVAFVKDGIVSVKRCLISKAGEIKSIK